MSAPIVLKTRHQLGVEGAKLAITQRYESLKQTVKIDRVGDSQLSWQDDIAHVSAKALGQRATATIDVAEENLTITIHLPMILAPFKGAIVAFLESQEDAVKGNHSKP